MISIITITYNNFEDLVKTLDSIHDYDNVESVVVNGGDLEETINYLKAYKGKVINEKDKGIADAFNKGIQLASGNFVMFLNSGDVLLNPGYLKEAIEFLNKNPQYSFVHSNILYDDAFGDKLVVKPHIKNPGRGMMYLHPSMIIRSTVFKETGLYDLNYKIAMDYDLILRMEKKGLKGFYIDALPVVQMEGKGKSHTSEFLAIKECIRSLRKNNYLTFKNITGLTVRLFLFSVRKILFKIGGRKAMRLFKRLKYEAIAF
jgi:glycosyltransferase involved in cell wall biosynthesis